VGSASVSQATETQHTLSLPLGIPLSFVHLMLMFKFSVASNVFPSEEFSSSLGSSCFSRDIRQQMVQQSLTSYTGDKLMCNDDIGNIVPRKDNAYCVFVVTVKTCLTHRDSPPFDRGVLSVTCHEMVQRVRKCLNGHHITTHHCLVRK
jgi:hypothetical protein